MYAVMSPMQVEFAKAVYLSSVCVGCWTCLSLIFSRKGDPAVKWQMLGFIALLLLPPLNGYVSLVLGEPLAWLQTLSHQISWMYGPLLLSLAQTILLQRPASRLLVWHFLPGVLATVALLLEWVPVPLLICVLLVQLVCYLVWTAQLLYGRWPKLTHLALQHKNTSYYWLLYLVAGLLLATGIDIVVYLSILSGATPAINLLMAVAAVLALYVDVIALFALYQPDIFSQSTTEDIQAIRPAGQSDDDLNPGLSPAARQVELSRDSAAMLEQQLIALVHSHQPHLDETMSLAKLAALLAVTPHQLSELLNIHMHSSFYEFLNGQRYEESLRILRQAGHELSIADIAYRAGFNNRNSFYKVFKHHAGITPAQYKKQLQLTM